MKTSILSKHQFLKGQLLELVEISQLIEQKDRFFISKFDQWLKNSERKLKDFGCVEASHFSVYRAGIFHCRNKKERNKNKLLFSKSIETIQLAQQSLYNLFLPFNQKITQAEETIENILVLIEDSEEFKNLEKQNFSIYINKVWQFILAHEAFQNHINQLKILVSLTDIKLIIGQKVTF